MFYYNLRWVIWAFVLVFKCLTVCLCWFGWLAFCFVCVVLFGLGLAPMKNQSLSNNHEIKMPVCRSSTGWCSGWTGHQQLRSLLGVYRVAQAMHCPAPSTMLQGMVISQHLTVQSVHAGGHHTAMSLCDSRNHAFIYLENDPPCP